MTNLQRRQKLRAVLKATILGCLLFAATSLIILCTSSDYFLYVRFLVAWPGIMLENIMDFEGRYIDSRAAAIAYMVIVNSFIGMLIFGGLTALWQLTKGDHEN